MEKREKETLVDPRFQGLKSEGAAACGPHLWDITAVRDLFWIGLIIAAIALVHYLSEVFVPIFIGLGLAYLFNPTIDGAERRWRIPRPVTALLLIVLLASSAIILIAWVGPILIRQAFGFVQDLPGYVDRLSKQYDLDLGDLPAQIAKAGQAFKNDPISTIETVFTGTGRFFGVVGSVIGITTSLLVSALLVPIYFCYFAWRFPAMLAGFLRFIPARRRNRVVDMARRIDDIVAAFFRARLIICALMIVMFALGWHWVGVPYALLLGLVTGLLNLVPFASIVGWPFALLLKYLQSTAGQGGFDWTAVLVWPSVVYLVVQFIEGWILTPLIHKSSTNLSAVTIMIVVFIGGALGGVVGFILAIPIASSVKLILDETVVPRLEAWASRA